MKPIINPIQEHQEDGLFSKLFMGQMTEITHTCLNTVRERSKTVFNHSSEKTGETLKMLSEKQKLPI